jgi:hypothetical protein
LAMDFILWMVLGAYPLLHSLKAFEYFISKYVSFYQSITYAYMSIVIVKL